MRISDVIRVLSLIALVGMVRPLRTPRFVKSIRRFIAWLARDLWVRVDFQLSCSACDHKVLFLDADNRVRRGALFVTASADPAYRFLVSYIDRSLLAEKPVVASNFFRADDLHVRWTYGWCRESAKTLLVAEALR